MTEDMLISDAGAEWRRYQARAYLESIRDSQRQIAALHAKARALRDTADGLKGIDYAADHVSTAYTSDAIPNVVASILEIGEKAAAMAEELEADLRECELALQSLGGWKETLLTMHYIGCVSLTEIGKMDEWKHDRQYMSVLHLQALDEFYDHMPHTKRERRYSAI